MPDVMKGAMSANDIRLAEVSIHYSFHAYSL